MQRQLQGLTHWAASDILGLCVAFILQCPGCWELYDFLFWYILYFRWLTTPSLHENENLEYIGPKSLICVQLLHYTSQAPSHAPHPLDDLMWFLGPEQKQWCQQSYMFSCCNSSETLFFCLHKHTWYMLNSFLPKSVKHCQETIPRVISHLSDILFSQFFLSDLLLCYQTSFLQWLWLSVSLFRNDRFLSGDHRTDNCVTPLLAQWYLWQLLP